MDRPELQRGFYLLFNLLKEKREGDILSEDEICSTANWKSGPGGSLRTYISKNKLSRYLLQEGTSYRVLKDGRELVEDEFYSDVTQVSPERLVLRRGMVLDGHDGQYTLLQEIGKGAVAHVWKANGPINDVAIKIVDPRTDLLPMIQNIKDRFRRECKNTIKLGMSGIIKHLDTGKYANRPFLVMEMADASVGQLLKREAVSVGEAYRIVEAVSATLSVLHEKKIVHRDIKPDNILAKGSEYLVGDFGIVKWSDFSNGSISAGTITKESLQLGSWYYMAPEQEEAPHDAVPASDIYALGVSWYQMLTNTIPTPKRMIARAIERIPGCDDAYEAILKMTSYSPEERPSAAEVSKIASKRT